MDKLSKKDIEHLAKLARLDLSGDEKEKFENELSKVLDYIGKLKEVDVKNSEAIAQVTELVGNGREDEVEPSLPTEDILRNAPEKQDNFLKVKAVK